MAAFLYEVEGLNLIVKILQSIIEDEDKDSPNGKRSQDLLESCNEILENYIGLENDFSCPNVKSIYHEFLLDILDEILGKGLFCDFLYSKMQIKNVQFCEQNDDMIILHVGEPNAS